MNGALARLLTLGGAGAKGTGVLLFLAGLILPWVRDEPLPLPWINPASLLTGGFFLALLGGVILFLGLSAWSEADRALEAEL